MLKALLTGLVGALCVPGVSADVLSAGYPLGCTSTSTVIVFTEVSVDVTTTVSTTVTTSTATETVYNDTLTDTSFTTTQAVVTEASVSTDTVYTTTITSTSYTETVSVPTFTSTSTITDLTTVTDTATITSVTVILSGAATISATTDTFRINAGQKRDGGVCKPLTTAWSVISFASGNATTTASVANHANCTIIDMTVTSTISTTGTSTATITAHLTATTTITSVSTTTISTATTVVQSTGGITALSTVSTSTLTTVSTVTVPTSTTTHIPSTTTTTATVTTTSTSISSVPTVQVTRARIYHRVFDANRCAWYGSNSDLGGDSPSDTFGSPQARVQHVADMCDQTDGCVNFYFYLYVGQYTNYGLSGTLYADSGNFCFDAGDSGQDAEAWDLVSDVTTTAAVT